MVGIVLVSHSHKLVEGLKELALQMVNGDIALAVAGGLDENILGTDLDAILAAINSVYHPDGVLVLIDLGSAELTTRLAIEQLSEVGKNHIQISPAPLVEGTLAAVLAASAGATLEEVNQAAVKALSTSKLAGEETLDDASTQLNIPGSHGKTLDVSVTILNPLGLHARPAARFAREAKRFESSILVSSQAGKTCPGDSIIGLIALGTHRGEQIHISATGPDAKEALEALAALLLNEFPKAAGPQAD